MAALLQTRTCGTERITSQTCVSNSEQCDKGLMFAGRFLWKAMVHGTEETALQMAEALGAELLHVRTQRRAEASAALARALHTA